MTLIEFDTTRYIRAKRSDVLTLLDEAGFSPDKLIAHRNRTYTARYERTQLPAYTDAEKRLQALDKRVAIFKRPSDKLDRGQYVTFKFALADTSAIGVQANGNAKDQSTHTTGQAAIMTELHGLTKDMKQLTQYAHDIAVSYHTHKHLVITLDELKKRLDLLQTGLNDLNTANGH